MNIILMLTYAVALSMDAFAVAISKGLCMQKVTPKKASIVGAWFGGFQGLMPFLGYLLGVVTLIIVLCVISTFGAKFSFMRTPGESKFLL